VLAEPVILVVSFAYLGLLFAIAHYGDRRAQAGRSIIASPYVYALSLAVYATSWTFYGSVGRAADTGIGFLPVYLGPTIIFALGLVVLRKIVRISKENRITSIADFVAARYGKSALLGGLVTVIAVIGIVPYISLQLKAISDTFTIVQHHPDLISPAELGTPSLLSDKAFYVALLLAAFTILFGTRKLDVTERHEGLVAAIAFESLVKLVAFLCVGLFVTFGLFGGFGDLFDRAAALPQASELFTAGGPETGYGSLLWLTLLSMLAVVLLPRQFQIAVVENVDERHLPKAVWLFPLYLLAINVFVLPIALGGLVELRGTGAEADYFVLTLPMADGQEALALFAYLGGLSAATGMVIVETIALSTMVSNNLVMPALLRGRAARLPARRDLRRLILGIRRATIVAVLLLGYAYFRAAGEATALVSIGLLSFAAVAQFAPAVLGGIFWKGATKDGALAGLAAGFVVWLHTLLLPSFARSDWLPRSFLDDGPFGIGLLRPERLFGLDGLDAISHGMFWSMLVNVGLYVGVSLFSRRDVADLSQAARFVDVFRRAPAAPRLWRGTVTPAELESLLARFVGRRRAAEALGAYGRERGSPGSDRPVADAELVQHVETVLAGSIGAASARVMVATVVDEEPLGIDEVMEILDETSQAIAYSHELERKSHELEVASAELRAANERLRELDRMKDDFISTVTHELRTPLTSMRAFSEILLENPDLEPAERDHFRRIVIEEIDRLTRLIEQILDLSKLESGRAEHHISEVDLRAVVEESAAAAAELFRERRAGLSLRLPEIVPRVAADRDGVKQVLLNLLSNAAKFCDPEHGRVEVVLRARDGAVRVDVRDNGPGIAPDDQEVIFEKFRQGGDTLGARPPGSGLGLSISREIITSLDGRLWVESEPGGGATFSFELPVARRSDGQQDPDR
jgi:Na+/proline symporter/nitrogen-specific signal transduction histidine kinase